MPKVKCLYNYKGTRHQVFYNGLTHEILKVVAPVWYKNDFVVPAIDTTNDVATAAEGTSAAAAISAAVNGTVLIDSGTDADTRSLISGELNYQAGHNLIFQCKLKTTTSDAAMLAFAGMTDNKDEGAGLLPLVDDSLVSGTIDSVADDLVGFGVRAETSDNIYAVSCKNNGTPQSTDTGYDLTLDTDYIFEVVCNSSGDARFYIDGKLVAVHKDAITATDNLTWFVGNMITDGSTAAFISLDYVLCAQHRS